MFETTYLRLSSIKALAMRTSGPLNAVRVAACVVALACSSAVSATGLGYPQEASAWKVTRDHARIAAGSSNIGRDASLGTARASENPAVVLWDESVSPCCVRPNPSQASDALGLGISSSF